MKTSLAIIILIILTLPSGQASAWLFGPSNYDECILENMKGVTNNIAARSIQLSCRKQFSEKQSEIVEITRDEIFKITGEAHRSGSYIVANLHNGTDKTITSVILSVSTWGAVYTDPKTGISYEYPKLDHEPKATTVNYRVDKEIKPLTSKRIEAELTRMQERGEFSWQIVKAFGRQ